ncbi:MAG: ABC transporter permease [Deltaproteobacteria bacterium RBG_13_52_11]|nr:MAG: ABC transporter permease [Deltaproteobacteria bacterium RBG_13_52_11]
MEYLWEGIKEAIRLIISVDHEVCRTVLLSLRISLTATALASFVGIPLGFLISTHEFPLKRPTITFFNTLLSLPTVVVGLFLYSLLSRQGPLGPLSLLFTPPAMVIGQFILATPIIVALTISAIQVMDPRVKWTAMTLGAGPVRTALTVFAESRFALIGAVIAGFGRVIAEVGAAMMVGGNIKGYTRIMTTAIALETSKGEFAFALSLGFILLAVAFSVNILFHYFQAKRG